MKKEFLIPLYIRCDSFEERKEIQKYLEKFGYTIFFLCEELGNGFISISTQCDGVYFLTDGNRGGSYDCSGHIELFKILAAVEKYHSYYVYTMDIYDEYSDYIIHHKGDVFKSYDGQYNVAKATKEDIINYYTR